MAESKIKFNYVGSGGEFLHGIPARDLTEADWERLTKAQQDIVTVSHLYRKPEPEAKPEASKKPAENK